MQALDATPAYKIPQCNAVVTTKTTTLKTVTQSNKGSCSETSVTRQFKCEKSFTSLVLISLLLACVTTVTNLHLATSLSEGDMMQAEQCF